MLFLYRPYPSCCPKEREEAIKATAGQCAREMGLEFYTDWSAESISQGKIIKRRFNVEVQSIVFKKLQKL